MLEIKHILVPVDFSPGSKLVVDYAVELAERMGASIEVLHVWEPPMIYSPDALVMPPMGSEIDHLARKSALEAMEALLAPVRERVTTDLGTRLESGLAYEVIMRVAAAERADMIIMGTHGRTGLSHLVLGSVAEKVIRSARCPVLTVRMREAETKKKSAAA